jgi:hypothetical protein
MDLENVPPPILRDLLDADRIGIAAWITPTILNRCRRRLKG